MFRPKDYAVRCRKPRALPELMYYAPFVQHFECSVQYPNYNREFIACELSPMEPAPPLIREKVQRSIVEMAEECYLTRQRYIRLMRIVKKLYHS